MITRLSMIVVAALLLLFGNACKTNQTTSSPANGNRAGSSSTPDQFASVRGIYEKECKACHGETGAGGPFKQKDGSTLKVPSLREGRAVRHEDSEFVKQITKGGDGMPDFGDKLSAEKINDLIKMIRKEFQGK